MKSHPVLYGYSHSAVEQKYVTPVLTSKQIPAFLFSSSDAAAIACNNRIREIYDIYAGKSFAYELEIQILLQRVWLSMLKLIQPQLVDTPIRQSADEKRLKNALNFIQQNYHSKITLEQIADSALVSKGECCRFFKKLLDVSPVQYLTNYRMEKSAELLKDPALSVSEIAAKVGFDSAGYFSTSFRKCYGCSPVAYRDRQNNSDGSLQSL